MLTHLSTHLNAFNTRCRDAGSYELDLDKMKEVHNSLDLSVKFSTKPEIYR